MNLPKNLQSAIEELVQSSSIRDLTNAAADLSQRYRQRNGSERALNRFMTNQNHRIAYAATRMPATYAAIERVLRELKERVPDLQVQSLLDLGAGPGTAMWAAAEAFPDLEKISLLEQDSDLIALGQRLARKSEHASVYKSTWHCSDLNNIHEIDPQDLIILSYVIGELNEGALSTLIKKVWPLTQKALILIEPGTMHGFERIRLARSLLLAEGALIVAPCPHAQTCPMASNDWCHFSQRVERHREHQIIKDAFRGFEDEKFSYLIVHKEPVPLPTARLLRHPLKRSGHIHLTLCTPQGIQNRIASRREGEFYQKARKLDWGDSI